MSSSFRWDFGWGGGWRSPFGAGGPGGPRTVAVMALALAMPVVMAEELVETVAYYLDRAGYEGVVRKAGEELLEMGEGVGTVVERPWLVEASPDKTRFLKDGDRMWMMTRMMKKAGVLVSNASWAVWNEGGHRLLVRGTMWEQGRTEEWIRRLNPPVLIGTEVELMRVPCREVGAVAWSAEEIRKRGGVSLGVMAVTARPGQKGGTAMAWPDGEGRLEVEPNMGATGEIVHLGVDYSVPVDHRDGMRRLKLKTGMILYSGHDGFHELGGADDAGTTCVIRVQSVPRFMNGRPQWRWRETEDESPTRGPPEPMGRGVLRTVLEDGLVMFRVSLPRTFFMDMTGSFTGSTGPGSDVDPFAPSNGEDKEKWAENRKCRRVVPPNEVPGCRKTDVVFDISEVLMDMGLQVPEGGWAYFNRTRSFLVAKLDAPNVFLLEALTSDCFHGPPKMVHTTVSVIEWEGELEPGKVPAGARRLARMGAVARPGQKVTVRHARPEEGLKSGVEMELETNIGANDRMMDLRMYVKTAGARPVRISTGLTLVGGKPVVVPVGEEGGKKLGLLLEGRVVDGRGRSILGVRR